MKRLAMLFCCAPLMLVAAEPAAPPTTNPPAAVADPAANSTPAAAATPAAPTPAARTLEPAVNTSTATPRRPGQDRLDLDTTQITGNRELPRVLYVVPWKRSDLGDLTGRPVNSLLDEVLAPVDRDVFRRQNRYYEALKPDTTGAKP
jgi:hypothetical protein